MINLWKGNEVQITLMTIERTLDPFLGNKGPKGLKKVRNRKLSEHWVVIYLYKDNEVQITYMYYLQDLEPLYMEIRVKKGKQS